MQLTNLQALWLLGLIPILIIIHNLKPRRKQMEVANLFLWQRVLKERGTGSHIQQVFLRNLLLMLQILMVGLCTLALAKPVRFYAAVNKGDIILVLDVSASMKTRTLNGLRFDQAIQKAQELVAGLTKESRMLIIEAAGTPVLRQPFTTDRIALQTALKQIEPTDMPGQLEKALYLALSFFNPGRDDRIYLITDGAGGNFEALLKQFPRMQPLLVAGGSKNAGITRFEFRQTLKSETQYEIMVEVKNFSPEPVICPFQVLLEEVPLYQETFELKPREKRLIFFPYEGLMTGTAVARLELEDDLAVDNEAYAVFHSEEDLWILLVTNGNYFLEKLLDSYPNFLINKVDRIDPALWEEQITQHDLVIVDHQPVPPTTRGSLLLINALSSSLPLKIDGQVDHPRVLDWDHQSPLLAHLELSRLNIARAARVRAAPFLKPLLEAPQTGLIYAHKQEGLRWIYFGFDLQQSDLPLRVAFPVMMSNMLQWLYPNKLQFSTAQTKSGDAFPLYFGVKTDHLLVLAPEGRWQTYPVQTNPFIYTETRQVGLYKVAEGEKRRYFAVNLADEAESDIQTPDVKSEAKGASRSTEEQTPIQTATMERPLWLFFLLLIPLLVLADWFFWLKEY
jgi:hypothetical protein